MMINILKKLFLRLESMLTPAERKKLRRQRRAERAGKIRDGIMMGLIAAPPPKVKFSNIMRVVGDEQIANPTQVLFNQPKPE